MTWQRMALGFVSLGAVTLGAAARRDTPWMVFPAAALFGLGAAIALYWRGRTEGGEHAAALRWLAVATVAVATMAAVLTVVHPG